MSSLNLTRNLRSLAFLIFAAAIPAVLAAIWWVNHTGLPDSWRSAIEKEIAKQGAHVEIGGLSYNPFRGVVATQLRVFSQADHRQEISCLQSVVLGFDKTKLARGVLRINKLEFVNVAVTLPVNPDDPQSENLEITKANGILFMRGDRHFELRGGRGMIAGIDLLLDARMIGYEKNSKYRPDSAQEGKRRQLFARIIGELRNWQFPADRPPQLRISLEGDVNHPSTISAKMVVLAKEVGKNGHLLEEVSAEAEVTGNLLTVTSLFAKDSSGTLEGRMDLDLWRRDGRFDVRSGLEIQSLLKSWLGLPPLRGITIAGSQTLDAQGEFTLGEKNHAKVQVTGHADCKSVTLRGVRFDTVKTAFSWKDDELFLRDAVLLNESGSVRGKALVQWPLVRIAIKSTMPSPIYRPFFIGMPLEKVIDNFALRKNASFDVELEGGFDATNPLVWAYTGGGTVKNVSYNGVPVDFAECRMSLNHHELDFNDGTVIFNYQDYPMRKEFNGPNQATAKVGRIRYDGSSKIVEIEDVVGAFWVAPLVRLFAPKVADSLEIYRFHRPPELRGNGVVDVTPQGRTLLNVSFSTNAAANYRFFGKDITLSEPTGVVAMDGPKITISPLDFKVFDGLVNGKFEVPENNKLTGDVSWTKLSIPQLTSTYGFEMKGGGEVTGRMNFALTQGKVETMQGEGLLALDNTELFAVPIFGPLSPLISGVLSDRRAGFERAKNAFCNFKIKDGVLSTRDFQTTTTSLVFAGDGSVNLIDQTIDITMRLNARGFLGLITLPLRPFYGLFQFRGTGHLKETQWENVRFTSPPEDQNQILLEPPKARIITP